jgi:hypothetical protein
VNDARWRPLGSQGENKTRRNIIFTAIYIQVYTRMRLQNQATGTAMPACHLGAMDHPVATSECC